jgi:hypothetical protein
MNVNLKDFSIKRLKKKDLKKILALRNQYKIRNSMLNKNIISLRDHQEWYKKMKVNKFYYFYCFFFKRKIIGAGYANNFNLKKKFCSWGLYRDQKIKSKIKLGSILKYLLIKKIFKLKKINYIKTQVIKGNERVKDWYESWGHQYVGYNKKNKYYNLILLKKNWNKKLLLHKKRIVS